MFSIPLKPTRPRLKPKTINYTRIHIYTQKILTWHNSIQYPLLMKNIFRRHEKIDYNSIFIHELKLNKCLCFFFSSSFMSHSLISMDISGNLFQSIPLESIRSIHTLSRLIAQRWALSLIPRCFISFQFHFPFQHTHRRGADSWSESLIHRVWKDEHRMMMK